MLDISTAKLVKSAIDHEFKGNGPLTLEDVVRMEPISKSGRSDAYTIIGSQFGDMTILVWLQFTKDLAIVRSIKTMAW